jgi:hypothetical protein
MHSNDPDPDVHHAPLMICPSPHLLLAAAAVKTSRIRLGEFQVDQAAARKNRPDEFLIVRPDQHIAWRGRDLATADLARLGWRSTTSRCPTRCT